MTGYQKIKKELAIYREYIKALENDLKMMGIPDKVIQHKKDWLKAKLWELYNEEAA